MTKVSVTRYGVTTMTHFHEKFSPSYMRYALVEQAIQVVR
jgi:hypothetical protein